jgi:hypothetical protein
VSILVKSKKLLHFLSVFDFSFKDISLSRRRDKQYVAEDIASDVFKFHKGEVAKERPNSG